MSRLSLIKTYSLSGLADGFDESTYLIFKPLSNDYSNEIGEKLRRIGNGNEEAALAIFIEAAIHAFQSGKIMVDGELVDAEADDLQDLGKVVLSDIFSTISQSKFISPKA